MATRNTARNSAGAIVLALSLMGMIRAAYADCSPNSAAATSGATVTCADTATAGFIAGAGMDNVTINITSSGIVQAKTTLPQATSVQINSGTILTNAGTIENKGGATATDYGVVFNGANSTFINNGTLVLSVTAVDIATTPVRNTRTLRGVYMSTPDATPSYSGNHIVNNGSITLNHAGVGNAQGFYPGEDIDDLIIDNSGTISMNRTSAITVTVSGGALQGATSTVPTPAALQVAAAIGSDDDAEMAVNNNAGGVIEATGDGTAAILVRAVELELTNHGTIRNNNVGGGIAISAHGAGTLEIENFGTITGDILAVDGNALRYWAKEAKGISGLTLNNQAGVRDSEIENGGTITGNIYLGSGTHEVENEGAITGNIQVDQAGIGTAIGARHFTLGNSGTLTGNITIRDNNAASINSITLVGPGFSGNISATNATGSNSLTLLGAGTLHNVTNFTTLTVGREGGGGGDDDDDDDEAGAGGGATSWTLLEGTSQQFTGGTTINAGASLTVDSTLTSDVTIASGGVLMGSGIIAGSITNGGTIDLQTTTLTATGSVTLEAGSTLKTTIKGNGSASPNAPSANAGLLVVGATGTADPSAKVVPVSGAALVRTGDWYRVATNSNGGSVFSTLPAVQNSALINWTIQENSASDLVIGATVTSAASIPGISSAGATVLNALEAYAATGDNEKLLAIAGELQSLPTQAAVRKAAEQLRPEANGAQSTIAVTISDRIQAVIDQRIAETNLAFNGGSGVSAGEGGSGRAGWVQGFGFYGQQDQRDDVDGYTASTGGIAIGGDTAIGSGDATRVGIALSFASSKIDDDGVNSGNTVKIDSYLATLYGSYAMPTWYVNGALGLGLHQYDGRRLITVGTITDVATSKHDGTQYYARVESGLPLQFGKNTLIPVASLAYSHLDQEAYTESSSAGAALAVDKVKTDSTRSGLGARMLFDISEPDTRTVVELRAIWLHEFGDVSQDTTARFAAGGASFTTSGVDIGRDSVNLGIGMRFSSANSRQQVLISYDAEIRDQYIGHTAMLQARQEF